MFVFIMACVSASIDGDRFQPPKLSIVNDTGEVSTDTGTAVNPLDVDDDGDGLSEIKVIAMMLIFSSPPKPMKNPTME